MPKITVMIQIDGMAEAKDWGQNSTCKRPMFMPTMPMIEPTDRSMLRVTMTSTIPVAMIPI